MRQIDDNWSVFRYYHIPALIRLFDITYSQLPNSIFRMRDSDTMIFGDRIILNR